MDLVARRLREVCTQAGLSQERLGAHAGLRTVTRIAAALKVPPSYFYAVSDDEADLLIKLHRMTKAQRAKVIAFVQDLAP